MTVITGPEGPPPPEDIGFQGFEVAVQEAITPGQFPELLRDFVIDQDALPEGIVELPVGTSVDLFASSDEFRHNQTPEERYSNPRIHIAVEKDGYRFSAFSLSDDPELEGTEAVLHTRGLIRPSGIAEFQKTLAGKSLKTPARHRRATEPEETRVMRMFAHAFSDVNYDVRVRPPNGENND